MERNSYPFTSSVFVDFVSVFVDSVASALPNEKKSYTLQNLTSLSAVTLGSFSLIPRLPKRLD